MSKVTIKTNGASWGVIRRLMKSEVVADQLEPFAQAVFDAAFRDPNDEYTASLQIGKFYSSGRGGRVSWQVGAGPGIGENVEAKRGTLQRALGEAGL